MVGQLKTVVLDAPDIRAWPTSTAMAGMTQHYADDEWVRWRPTGGGSGSSTRPTTSRRSGPTRPIRSSSTWTVRWPTSSAAAERAEELGARGWAAGRAGTRWPTRPGTRSTCARGEGTTGLRGHHRHAEPQRWAGSTPRCWGWTVTYDGDEGSLIGAEGRAGDVPEGRRAPPAAGGPTRPIRSSSTSTIGVATSTRPSGRRWRWARPGCRATARTGGSTPTRPATPSACSPTPTEPAPAASVVEVRASASKTPDASRSPGGFEARRQGSSHLPPKSR